jgi:hypothetical protein
MLRCQEKLSKAKSCQQTLHCPNECVGFFSHNKSGSHGYKWKMSESEDKAAKIQIINTFD